MFLSAVDATHIGVVTRQDDVLHTTFPSNCLVTPCLTHHAQFEHTFARTLPRERPPYSASVDRPPLPSLSRRESNRFLDDRQRRSPGYHAAHAPVAPRAAYEDVAMFKGLLIWNGKEIYDWHSQSPEQFTGR